ncbi:MAG: glutathione S-transferase family protein [Pseudomonadota bacterium]
MSNIILHHYPQSPVAEKVRAALGLKSVTWRAVEIPRIPPKPDLMPLTGGYRRTPVMQIGADIYCDSQCILQELERRIPRPTLFPNGDIATHTLAARMIEDTVFLDTVRMAICGDLANVPEALAQDRGRLYFGPDFDLEAEATALPHTLAQLNVVYARLEAQLSDGRKFLTGSAPGLLDLTAYHVIWFLRGRYAEGPKLLSQYPALEAMEARVAALGHGTPSDLESTAALDIARDAKSSTRMASDPLDPQGLKPGERAAITPLGDGGDPSVKGALQSISKEVVSILRDDPRVGEICIHFPRAGYHITPLD